MPVHELKKEKEYLEQKVDRARRELEEMNEKVELKRQQFNMPEDQKSSASAKVQTMREQIRNMHESQIRGPSPMSQGAYGLQTGKGQHGDPMNRSPAMRTNNGMSNQGMISKFIMVTSSTAKKITIK